MSVHVVETFYTLRDRHAVRVLRACTIAEDGSVDVDASRRLPDSARRITEWLAGRVRSFRTDPDHVDWATDPQNHGLLHPERHTFRIRRLLGHLRCVLIGVHDHGGVAAFAVLQLSHRRTSAALYVRAPRRHGPARDPERGVPREADRHAVRRRRAVATVDIPRPCGPCGSDGRGGDAFRAAGGARPAPGHGRVLLIAVARLRRRTVRSRVVLFCWLSRSQLPQ